MSQESNERAREQERVDRIVQEIVAKEDALYSKSAGLKETVVDLRKTFWDEIKVNVDEPDDIIETQESIKQQAALLAEKERFHGKVGEELRKLERLKNSPYFGRIDFVEDGWDEKDRIYIGIGSLMDREEEDFLIYDWRAPISSLYYDYPPGKASYWTLDHTITGEITLKRQFIIRQGEIKGMFDTGVTIGDQLLQEALGNNANTTMKNIVATIQREQNLIIRNERSSMLIVQGVAGSGKTSAALQRIAYLMYRYRGELNPENVVLFSPNPLFGSYISNVLPELGENNVRQTTFLDYLKDNLKADLKVQSPFEQMEYVLGEEGSEEYEIRMQTIDFLSNLEFKRLIDDYTASLRNGNIAFRNIRFQGSILISKEEIADYFYSLDPEMIIPNKMEHVSRWLTKELKGHMKREKDEDWVLEQIELLSKEDYVKAYREAEKKTDEWDVSFDEEEVLRRNMVKRFFRPLMRRVKNLDFVDIPVTYKRLFTGWTPAEAPEEWETIRRLVADDIANGYLTWENAAPYMYFKGLLLGSDADRAVRQLIIDEAQDYSAFQLAYIRHIFPNTKMTLLGDVNQAIYTYATKENPLVSGEKETTQEKITLTKSYRSTKQISEFTKYFAPGGELIEPFSRDGLKPQLVSLAAEHVAEALVESYENLVSKGYETIAIICKTLRESEAIANLLKERVSFRQINEETYEFEKGLIVVPVYLAKGIEFDAVILPDASQKQYGKESDRTIFYTACTRAMHELVMFSQGDTNRFIKEVPTGEYEESTFHTSS